MALCSPEFERIRTVLEDVETGEPLTARQIHEVLEAHGEEFESPHRIATILGRQARRGDVQVIEDKPYRYQIAE